MSECTHRWAVSSECPYCLRSKLNEACRLVDGMGETMRVMNEVAQGWKQSAIKAESDLAAALALLREANKWIGRDCTSVREQIAELAPLCNRIDAALAGEGKP